MNNNTTDTTEQKPEYRFIVVLDDRFSPRNNSLPIPNFWRSKPFAGGSLTYDTYGEDMFEIAGWDTMEELPGFVMLIFDNDDTVMIHKDCIKSISILPYTPHCDKIG